MRLALSRAHLRVKVVGRGAADLDAQLQNWSCTVGAVASDGRIDAVARVTSAFIRTGCFLLDV